MPFARLQGRGPEKALLAAGFLPPCTSSGPAYIYPVEPRKEPNFSYRLLRGDLTPAFSIALPNQVISGRREPWRGPWWDVALRGTGERGRPNFRETMTSEPIVEAIRPSDA